jgi:hypothetical protein
LRPTARPHSTASPMRSRASRSGTGESPLREDVARSIAKTITATNPMIDQPPDPRSGSDRQVAYWRSTAPTSRSASDSARDGTTAKAPLKPENIQSPGALCTGPARGDPPKQKDTGTWR